MGNNPVVCWELASHDQERSAEFFRKVFEWEVFLDDELGFYRVRPPAGDNPAQGFIFTLRRAKLPFVAVYIAVEDIRAKARLVEECGGLIVQGPEEPVPGSLVCLFNEPSGVCFAMIQQRRPRGAGGAD